jgi:hypothetical protein
MSMISFVSIGVSTYQAPVAGSAPVSGAAPSPPPQAWEHEHHHSSRENTFVSAMMAALQGLGLGQPAAAATPPPVDVPDATTPVATTPVPVTADPMADADTIDKAVKAFAHALFGALHQIGRGEHVRRGEGDDHGEHSGGTSARSARGYDGLVQRLEQLASSLGASPAAASAPAPLAPAATPVAAATPVEASEQPTAGAAVDGGASVLNRKTNRLLAAFGNLMAVLKPASSTAPEAPTVPASASTPMADKLRLFLQTLAQSMHTASAAPPVSASGSLLDVRA